MILQLFIAVFSLLFSVWGVVILGLGLVTFFLLPVISMASRFKIFARFFLWLAALPLRRAALVVSEHNDVYFKQMSFVGRGVELIEIDDKEKEFSDPDGALHHWLGIPFSFADEEHGVLFDPRHAATGQRKKELESRARGVIEATKSEWEEYGVTKWLPHSFEMPQKHELVDLSAVQAIIDGGERAEHPEQVETLYQNSRDPFEDDSLGGKFLIPLIGGGLIFGGIWVLSSQIGQPDTTVSYTILPALGGALAAALPLLGSADDGDDDQDRSEQFRERVGALKDWLVGVDWAFVAGVAGLLGTPTIVAALVVIFFGPIVGGSILLIYVFGVILLPLLTLILQVSSALGGALSLLYFRLGMLGYRQPVLEWTPQKYRLREYDQLETTENVTWYDAFGSLLGVTYQPGKASWQYEYHSHEEMEAIRPASKDDSTRHNSNGSRGSGIAMTDGGNGDTNLPGNLLPTEENIDTYGRYVPKRIRDDRYYIDAHLALNRFTNSAVGEKSMNRLNEAKEKYGDANQGIDDMVVFKATLVSGFVAGILGISIFILPYFL